MTDKTTRPWRLVEVWGDTADEAHLAWSIGIGIVLSLAAYLVANRLFRASVASPDLARAYAMLAGLAGCVASGVLCAALFPPKRDVVEGAHADPAWRQEVLARLAEQVGDLGAVSDLPPAVIAEMRELEIYELFARWRPAADAAPASIVAGDRAKIGPSSAEPARVA